MEKTKTMKKSDSLAGKSKNVKKFDSLDEILPGREAWSIKVRVIRLWKVPAFLNPSETNSIEMVLIDEKGGKIHATIRKQLLYMFQSKVEEGGVYQMSYFSVSPTTGYYRTSLHPYKLIFQIKTKVAVSESSTISNYGLTLTSLGEVCAHIHDYEYLVDVIGLMTGISPEKEYVRDGKITKMVVVELTDHSGKCECALFGDYVDELNKLMGKSKEGLPVVVIQFAKVKIFRDKASIQNVINTTRILVNPQIPEVEGFKNGIAVHGIDTDTSVPLIGSRGKAPMDEEFLRMHPKKTMADLMDMSENGIFAACGTVVAIVGGQEWWYPACKCHKSVIPDSGSYYCNSCARHVFHVIPRFKVKLQVSDGDATCVFIVFDSDMSYIMEKSCAHFVAASKVDKSGSYPIEFESLIGKKMLFTLDCGNKPNNLSDGSFRVKRVCMDPTIIETFCAEGPYSTPSKSIAKAVNLDHDDDYDSGDDADDEDSSSDDVDVVGDSQDVDFINELIVTPPELAKKVSKVDVNVPSDGNSVKRNLSSVFEDVAQVEDFKRLRPVKVEKE